MTTPNSGNAQDLAILREKAKGLGIKSYQIKGYDKLYTEVMAELDKQMEKEKAKQEKLKEEQAKNNREEAKERQENAKQEVKEELYPFTDPKTGKIGLYILTDKKNTIPYKQKGTAYRFVRWQ